MWGTSPRCILKWLIQNASSCIVLFVQETIQYCLCTGSLLRLVDPVPYLGQDVNKNNMGIVVYEHYAIQPAPAVSLAFRCSAL
jgi:hypothetical protein